MYDLTKRLCETWGPSGYEHHVRALIQAEVAELADDIRVDALGNLICRVGSGGTKILIDAHMDEIGIMATFNEPKSGYLRFAEIGGLKRSALVGSRVRFEDGTLGVVNAHDLQGNSLPDIDHFYIDVSDGSDARRIEA
ncbi:MAG: M42 family peptidase, partial [Armatimonadetes bacterium]|nr:M42 family peptidase [Anaerolineae bacterium]